LKALILIGGYATRLRPLSLNKPKCLFPLNGKPIIDYLLEGLVKAGCTEAVLALNNLADRIEQYLETTNYGIKITYSRETEPLGTGGPVKLAEEALKKEPFLVLNGDILSWIDYRDLMNKHLEGGAAATIALKQVDDPSRYGVARFRENGMIAEFVEKPPKAQAPSNWINAGCYAMSPQVIDLIPSGNVSLERVVFPELARRGSLKAYLYHGEWMDIGVPSDYLKADRMLRGKRFSVGENTVIGPGAVIENSIIWGNISIGSNAHIIDTIIGDNCVIGDNVTIEGAVIADGVQIDAGLVVSQGAKIYPHTHLEASVTAPKQEIM